MNPEISKTIIKNVTDFLLKILSMKIILKSKVILPRLKIIFLNMKTTMVVVINKKIKEKTQVLKFKP